MFSYSGYKIYLACGATDMRKAINGLCDIVQNEFNLDPRDKIIFAFCNRQRNRLKLLVWEDNGFWLHFKRIERGTMSWPQKDNSNPTMVLTLDDIKNIIKAPGIRQKIRRNEVWKN